MWTAAAIYAAAVAPVWWFVWRLMLAAKKGDIGLVNEDGSAHIMGTQPANDKPEPNP